LRRGRKRPDRTPSLPAAGPGGASSMSAFPSQLRPYKQEPIRAPLNKELQMNRNNEFIGNVRFWKEPAS
jgi:hypothetical protein